MHLFFIYSIIFLIKNKGAASESRKYSSYFLPVAIICSIFIEFLINPGHEMPICWHINLYKASRAIIHKAYNSMHTNNGVASG